MGTKWVAGWMCLPTLLVLFGCTMRVPVDGVDFSREEKVVLTFQDGSSMVGRIDNGETVTYSSAGRTFRGAVESVDETEIVVADLVTLDDTASNRYQAERIRDFRLYVDEEDLDRLIVERDQILSVERMATDKAQTIRRVVFWSMGVGAALLAARDRNF